MAEQPKWLSVKPRIKKTVTANNQEYVVYKQASNYDTVGAFELQIIKKKKIKIVKHLLLWVFLKVCS